MTDMKQIFRSMDKRKILPVFVWGLIWLCQPVLAQQYIADHTVAREDVLRSIPREYIDKARTELVVAYQHTSHGTHVSQSLIHI